MSKSTLQLAATPDVWPLLNRLIRLKRAWPGEPGLRSLDSRMIEALLEFISAQDKARFTVYWPIILLILFGELAIAMVSPVFALGIFVPMLILGFAMCREPGRLQRLATYALTQTDDLRVLPMLIKATRHEWGRHDEIFCTLLRLLKQVGEEHDSLLHSTLQNRLWNLAIVPMEHQEHYNETLALETIRVMAHIGNGEMLLKMQRLAEQTPLRPPHQRAIEAAQEVLPHMEARFQRQQMPQTLLRAANMPVSQPEILLRPAYAADSEPAEQLLRASTSQERE